MKFDFLKLKYMIKAKFNTQIELAKKLGISETALNNKLNNRVPFRIEEIYTLIELLEIKNEDIKSIFFTTQC